MTIAHRAIANQYIQHWPIGHLKSKPVVVTLSTQFSSRRYAEPVSCVNTSGGVANVLLNDMCSVSLLVTI